MATSKKQTVFITQKIAGNPRKQLEAKGFRVIGGSNTKPLPQKTLIAKAKKADAVLSLLNDSIDKKFIAAVKGSVKVIANYAVGYDNIDLKAAKDAGITVTNTPGILSQPVAEHAIALMLAVSRRIVEADIYFREKKYKGWDPLLMMGQSVYDKTVGIIGLGRIGQSVAQSMHLGFGAKILYVDKYKNKIFEKEYHAKKVTLATLLKKSDIVSVHVPLLPSTKHLIGAKELKLMKKNAVLINTSRGPVINESALVTALKKKKIYGAGLDVFENEPKPARGLTSLKNVVLTPHIASATLETREEMADLAVRNIVQVLSGKPAITKVK